MGAVGGRRAVVGIALVGVPVLAVVIPAPWSLFVGAVGLAVGVLARRAGSNLAAAALFASAAVALAMGVSGGVMWPIPPAAALAIYAGVTWRAPALGVRSWFRLGDRDRPALVVAVASIPITTIALVAFIASGRTDLQKATDGLDGLPFAVIVLAGVGFALVNPAVEEVLFRGLLQPALVSIGASTGAAIALQAAAFGALHLHGIPGGPLGMAMAGLWGAMLGFVRHRTNGLRLVWLVHVAANATIFTTLVVAARVKGVL